MEQSRPIPQPSDKKTPTTTDAFLCIFTLDFCVISACFTSHMNTTSIHHTERSSSADSSIKPQYIGHVTTNKDMKMVHLDAVYVNRDPQIPLPNFTSVMCLAKYFHFSNCVESS